MERSLDLTTHLSAEPEIVCPSTAQQTGKMLSRNNSNNSENKLTTEIDKRNLSKSRNEASPSNRRMVRVMHSQEEGRAVIRKQKLFLFRKLLNSVSSGVFEKA